MRQLGKALTGSCYVGIIFGVGIPRFYRVLRVLCVFLDGFLWCKRGELMVLCGHLGGRFSGSKKCHLLKIFLWIFLVTGWWGGSRRTVGNRRSGDRFASTTAFLQKLPNASSFRC
jgi:hypothetical protein